MRSRKSTTRCKAKARRPAGRPCSAALPAVICGLAARRIAPRRLCDFCDTDFVGTDGPGGGKFADADTLARTCRETWRGNSGTPPFVVLTGGEPMLQVDEPLVAALHAAGFEVAIETNGTLPVLSSIDWVCVSPKAGAPLRQRSGDELKLVYPQEELWPEEVQELAFTHFLLQPMDAGARSPANVRAAIDYCLAHPKWRLSLQTHKLLGLP